MEATRGVRAARCAPEAMYSLNYEEKFALEYRILSYAYWLDTSMNSLLCLLARHRMRKIM
jgi:hypothetical protein